MSRKPPRESDAFKKELYYAMTPKRPRTFSERMAKLRQPFLYTENCSKPQTLLEISKISKEQFQYKHDDAKKNLKTTINENKLSFKQNYLEIRSPASFTENAKNTEGADYSAIEADYSHAWDSGEEKEKSLRIKDYTKEFGQEDHPKYTHEMQMQLKHTDKLKKAPEKCQIICKAVVHINGTDGEIVKPNDSQLSEISGYYTEESEHKTNISPDTSVENLSYQLQPLKNSTFIQEEIMRYGTSYENKNEENLVYEENRKLKAKIMEMELCKQIETKDKVMCQLLEVAKSAGFPNLKHLCNKECERGIDGICKKIKHDHKVQEEYGGLLRYIWSTIKYPFTSLPPIAEEKNDRVGNIINLEEVKRKPIGKDDMKLNCKKESLEDTEGEKSNNKPYDEFKRATENGEETSKLSDCLSEGKRESVKLMQALTEHDSENIKTNILEDHMNNKDDEVLNIHQGAAQSSSLENSKDEKAQKYDKAENKPKPRRGFLYFFQKQEKSKNQNI